MASGKSTLMSALCGEIKKTKGDFDMFDRTVYVPNSPWLKSGTIRDNILFGCSSSHQGITHRSKLYEKVQNLKPSDVPVKFFSLKNECLLVLKYLCSQRKSSNNNGSFILEPS